MTTSEQILRHHLCSRGAGNAQSQGFYMRLVLVVFHRINRWHESCDITLELGFCSPTAYIHQ